MSHNIDIHQAQVAILRELLFRPSERFADLRKASGLESDHFKFHIKKVVDLGYVEKLDDGSYGLTISGKEHANKLDTDAHTVERQPKVAVLLLIETEGQPSHYVFQQRIKQPFYGYWGLPSGKVRWGETLLQTAARELMEETGLTAQIKHKHTYHVHTVSEDGALLEDKIFFLMHCRDAKGDMFGEFEGGRNEVLTAAELLSKDKVFDDTERTLELITKPQAKSLTESTMVIESSEF